MHEKDIERNRQAILGLQRAIDAVERQMTLIAESPKREGTDNAALNRKIIDLVEKFKVYVSRNDVLLSTFEDRMGKIEGTQKEMAQASTSAHKEFILLKGTMEGKQAAEFTGRHQLAVVREEIDRAAPKEDSAMKSFMRDKGPLMGLVAIITALVNVVAYLVERLVP